MAVPGVLKNRALILCRVLPRIASPMATPTDTTNPMHKVQKKNVRGMRAPIYVYDSYLKRFFKEEHDLLALVPEGKVKTGDTVLIRKLEKSVGTDIHYQFEEVVSEIGNYKDPFSKEPVSVNEYRSNNRQIAEWYGGRRDNFGEGFDYEKAPPKGWQEGKKDFSEKSTYYKWHVFDKKDQDDYSLVT